MTIIETRFQKRVTVRGVEKIYSYPIKYAETGKGRIEFVKAGFQFKDEIKSMKGSQWHGYINGDNRKIWSVDDCTRNRFQMEWLEGGNPYAWFDQEIIDHEYPKFGSDGFGYFDLMSQQRLMADTILTYHYGIWGAEMGLGKAMPYSTPVATPTGWSTMGELEVGSRLIDPDGGECKVLSIHPQGTKEIFKVTFTDGSSTHCCGEHLWRVITPAQKNAGEDYQVMELQELMAQGLHRPNGNPKWHIPMVEPVEFDAQETECHPYLMGYILGDGFMRDFTLTIPYQETVDRLNSLMDRPLRRIRATQSGPTTYRIMCQRTRFAILTHGITEYSANSNTIPEEYLFNTSENRTLLLQGLMDADGIQSDTNRGIEFNSPSETLTSSVMFLIQSMGGICRRHTRTGPANGPNRRNGRLRYRVRGTLNSQTSPFLLTQNVERYTAPTVREPTRAIDSVESIGNDEAMCIKVDSATNCYVTEEFIVTHNTLAAFAVMKMSETKGWWWVGPKSSLYGIKQEASKWGLSDGTIGDMMSYEGMVQKLRHWRNGDPAPIGVVFDESQRLKTATAQRTQAAQKLADAIRKEYDKDGFVIEMTGTPSPKSPKDWWAQCEIAWPGFVKEGNVGVFEQRLGFFRLRDDLAGQAFNTRTAWRDDKNRCGKCGLFENEGNHLDEFGTTTGLDTDFDVHTYCTSVNEVADLYPRLEGLVTIVHKKDCLDLPDKVYKEILCEPSKPLLRVAGALTKTAPNVITGLTWLRELSDGFQYRDVEDGYKDCPACKDGTESVWHTPDGNTIWDIELLSEEFAASLTEETIDCGLCKGTQKVVKFKRLAREVPCPKEQAVVDLLEQCEEQRRIVFFAGFTGSLDRVTKTCQREGWDTMRVDGRGWRIERLTGEPNEDGSPKVELIKLENPMDYWIENPERKIAFVAHPKSGGISLTLCPQANRPGATVCCFYSNDFDPASRAQAEDRIHRVGMDEIKGATIVDLFHLPTDRRVLDVLKANRKLELMTMGDFEKDLVIEDV